MKLHASVVILEDEAGWVRMLQAFLRTQCPLYLHQLSPFRLHFVKQSSAAIWSSRWRPTTCVYVCIDRGCQSAVGLVLRPRPCRCLFLRSKKWGCFWRTGKDDQEGLADQLGFGNLARTQKKLSFPGLDWLIEHHWFKWNTTIPVGTRRKSDLRYLRCLLLLLYHRLKLKLMLYSCCNVRHFVEMRPGKCSWDKRKSQDATLCDTIHAEVHVSLENAWI